MNKKGFTLIELLVVVAMVGLLSSIILASLSSARDKASDSKKLAMVNQYQKAIELFYGDNSFYPSTNITTSRRVCLGYGNPNEVCFEHGNTRETFGIPTPVNDLLIPYIPGPPPNTDTIDINGTNFSGIAYTCLPVDPMGNVCGDPSDGYVIFWVMKNPNANCAGGFSDQDEDTPISSWDPSYSSTNTLCVLPSERTLYDAIYND